MLSRDHIEQTIQTYFDGCNEADADKMLRCIAPEATHYFPAGAPQGTFVGADEIAHGWIDFVERLDSRWTIDSMLIDERRGEAVIEWTHFKHRLDAYLRGDEWYRFNAEGLIVEIRAYYACPASDPALSAELGDFPYVDRGYATVAPDVVRVS